MQITRNEAREEEVMNKLRNRPRLEGEHLTEAIYCSRKNWALARLAAVGEKPGYSDGALLRMVRGTLRGEWMEDGEMSQIECMTPDDASVGTIDIWRGFVVEGKSTEYSVNRDIGEMDNWLLQLGGYVARAARQDTETAKGELWIVYEKGDHGKKRCPDHGYPDVRRTRLWEPTGKQRMVCPECDVFLEDGNNEPTFRVYEIRWTREELTSLHRLLTERLALLKADIVDAERYSIVGELPPIRWGYTFECDGCPVRDRIGCEGMAPEENLEEEKLEKSLLAAGKSIEEILMEVLA